jgi:hypothetical protein
MRKRIALLITALMLALTMSFGAAGAALADPDCSHVGDNNKNCVTRVNGPGGSENAKGKAAEKNPNFTSETTFKGRPQ